MADLTLKRHDTFPYLRGLATGPDGALPLGDAASLKIILKSTSHTIEGVAEAIDPEDKDGMNWRYKWALGDTAETGTFLGELEITWDAGSTPPEIQSVPSSGTVEVVIESDLG